MPNPSKQKTLDDWGKLLAAVQENEADLAGVGPFLDAMAKARTRTLALRMRRDTAFVAAIDLARQAREALAAGREAAATLRGFIRCVLGRRTEKLRLYGLKPLGPRVSAAPRSAAAGRRTK
jgi:hypothetical protein